MNATAGLNAAINSVPVRAGGAIVLLSTAYGSVKRMAQHRAAQTGEQVVMIDLTSADTADTVVGLVEQQLQAAGDTSLVIVDGITSNAALRLPSARVAAACEAAGVPVLVDSAHAMMLEHEPFSNLGPHTICVVNAHKWFSSPKGAAFMWAGRGTLDPQSWLSLSRCCTLTRVALFGFSRTKQRGACCCR